MANVEDPEKIEAMAATVVDWVSTIGIRKEADRVVRKHVLYSMGAGLVPVPLIDIAAVTAVQIDMLRQLAVLYGADYDATKGKAFASALAGGTFARIGASVVKSIPGVGTIVGGMSMVVLSGSSTYAVGKVARGVVVLSGSSTYAVGKVARGVFESGRDLASADMEAVKEAYKQQFEEGKQYVSNLRQESVESEDVFQALERLSELKGKGVIGEDDFQTQKQKLLDRL